MGGRPGEGEITYIQVWELKLLLWTSNTALDSGG